MTPTELVLSKLPDAKRHGDQFLALCPAHEADGAKHKPSLSVGCGDDGRALVYCHVGCNFEDICSAMGLKPSDLMPSTNGSGRARPAKSKSKGKDSTVYPTAEAAIIAAGRQAKGTQAGVWKYPGDVFRVARFDLPNGKTYRPVHQNGQGWIIGDPPGLLPLYRGDKIPATGPLAVVEGEKACDAAWIVDLSCVTSAHGAKSAGKSDWSLLAGRHVIILPDNDDPGRKYAADVAKTVMELMPPAVIKIVELPDLDDGGDIVDWIDPDVGGLMGDKDAETIKAAVLELAESAPPYAPPAEHPAESSLSEAKIIRLRDVEPQAVRWLWPGRIPLGKLTLLVGDPGLGKSFITLDIAARCTAGTSYPDGATSERGGVVLLSAEDDVADTIRPRLDAAGADVSRIVALEAVRRHNTNTGQVHEHMFSLSDDLPALESAIHAVEDCRLIIIDPISAYLAKTDAHRNEEVRGVLAPLAALAAQHGVAVVCVSHLRKSEGSALYRGIGSIAFAAAARAAFIVCKDRSDNTGRRRLLLPTKSNLGTDTTGFAYRLEPGPDGMPLVLWERDPVTVTADDALTPPPSRPGPPATKREEAAEWLTAALAAGPRDVGELEAEARRDGITEATLRRAKEHLGIKPSRAAFKGPWQWELPDSGGLPR